MLILNSTMTTSNIYHKTGIFKIRLKLQQRYRNLIIDLNTDIDVKNFFLEHLICSKNLRRTKIDTGR